MPETQELKSSQCKPSPPKGGTSLLSHAWFDSKSVTDSMKLHEWVVLSDDDPVSQTIGFAISCPECGSVMKSKMTLGTVRDSVRRDAFFKAMERLVSEAPADCDEAFVVNASSYVHES